MIPILPSEADVLAAAWEATAEPDAHAREVWGGPLPRLRSMEWVTAPLAVRRATLLTLGLDRVLFDPRQLIRERLYWASQDVHGGDRERWRRLAFEHDFRSAG